MKKRPQGHKLNWYSMSAFGDSKKFRKSSEENSLPSPVRGKKDNFSGILGRASKAVKKRRISKFKKQKLKRISKFKKEMLTS